MHTDNKIDQLLALLNELKAKKINCINCFLIIFRVANIISPTSVSATIINTLKNSFFNKTYSSAVGIITVSNATIITTVNWVINDLQQGKLFKQHLNFNI